METAAASCTEALTLQIRLEHLGPATVLDLDGRLTAEGTRRLCVSGEWTAGTNARCVIVDMRRVRQLDCAGVGQLAALAADVSRFGGRCALVHVERRQRVLLDTAGLRVALPVFESRDAALDWLTVAAGDKRRVASVVRSLAGWVAHGAALAAPVVEAEGSRRIG